MSDFKAKMHQIRFRLGLRPRPRWGKLTALPRPIAGFQGPTSIIREGRERGGEGEGSGRERKRGEGRYKGSLLLREGRGKGGKG